MHFIRRNVFNMLLKMSAFLLCMDLITVTQSYLPGCPELTLEKGKVRVKQRGRLVRFQCLWGYELVGQRFAACTIRGWDTSVPKCIRPGCTKLLQIENGMNLETRNGAATMFFCNPGFTLIGEGATYCDGRKWNGTVPTCKNNDAKMPPLSCDFETDTCGWTTGAKHDYDWERSTPSEDFPPYTDHTDTKHENGHFMRISDTSLKMSDSALLISPLFPANLTTAGCFSFYYFTNDPLIEGVLRVYVHPESVTFDSLLDDKQNYMMVEIIGEQENGWQLVDFDFTPLNEDFQIVIEASKESYTSVQMTIDDLSLNQKEQCLNRNLTAKGHKAISILSCYNRCTYDPFAGRSLCHCNETCLTDPRLCCSDYNDYCVFGISEPRGEYTDIYSTQEYSTTISNTTPVILNSTFTPTPYNTGKEEKTTTSNINSEPKGYTTKTVIFRPHFRNMYTSTPKTEHDDGAVPTKYFDEAEIITTPKKVEIEPKTSTTITTKTSVSKKIPITTNIPTLKTTTTKPLTTKPTTKTTLKTTKAAVEKPTLQFKTPPQPLKNATGILNKTTVVVNNATKMTVNVTKMSTTNGIKVIPLTKPTTKIPKVTTFSTTVSTPMRNTTLDNVLRVSKTFEHYGRHTDGKMKNATLNFTTNRNSSKYVLMDNGNKQKDSEHRDANLDIEDLDYHPNSTLSEVVIIFLCLAVTIAITVIVLTKTGHLRRIGDLARSVTNRMPRRRSESSADMRFLVEDEELEHDL